MSDDDDDDSLCVYVAGTVGEKSGPLLVTYSLESAMVRLLNANSVPGDREDSGYPEKWTCEFLSGESEDLFWTLTLPTGEQLYILKCNVEADRRDPKTGWRE